MTWDGCSLNSSHWEGLPVGATLRHLGHAEEAILKIRGKAVPSRRSSEGKELIQHVGVTERRPMEEQLDGSD